MDGKTLIIEGLKNWKLRLVLSALLCIMGLSVLISVAIGAFVELSVYDKSIVAVAIWVVGIPAYLILSDLKKVGPEIIVEFLNQRVSEIDGNARILLEDTAQLDDQTRTKQEAVISYFKENPLHNFLPDKPVKQAYFLMVLSMISSFSIWLFL